MSKNIVWKKPCNEFVPQTAVQVIPVDPMGNMLMMHRSKNVRSAANVWSFPSGLHDIGERVDQCAARELKEEYGLIMTSGCHLGVYENIAGDDPAREQFHWVMIVVAGLVKNVLVSVNKEPEKHDVMRHERFERLATLSFDEYPFHMSFQEWLAMNRERVVDDLRELTGCAKQ